MRWPWQNALAVHARSFVDGVGRVRRMQRRENRSSFEQFKLAGHGEFISRTGHASSYRSMGDTGVMTEHEAQNLIYHYANHKDHVCGIRLREKETA